MRRSWSHQTTSALQKCEPAGQSEGESLCPQTLFLLSSPLLFLSLAHPPSPPRPHSLSKEACTLSACRFPVVAMGVLKWVDWTVSEPRYFQLQTDHTPVHLALLDEVRGRRATCEVHSRLCLRPLS